MSRARNLANTSMNKLISQMEYADENQKKEIIMNKPLQKFKVIKGNQLISFLMYQFDYTRKQAEFLESRMVGGFKVQVIS